MHASSPLLAAVALWAGTLPFADLRTSSSACEVSVPVADRPRDDPHASTFASPAATWYANADRTLWVWWWGRRYNGEYKVLWVGPTGERVNVRGDRVDAPSGSFTQTFPPNGLRATFTTGSLAFPEAGCWRLNAAAGGTELEFVVAVP
jgi:hypothetical protein